MKTPSRVRIIVWLVLVALCSALFGGAIVYGWMVSHRASVDAVDVDAGRLSRLLGLDSAQTEQVKGMLVTGLKEIELLPPGSIAERVQIRQKFHSALQQILTPAQRVQFDAYRASFNVTPDLPSTKSKP